MMYIFNTFLQEYHIAILYFLQDKFLHIFMQIRLLALCTHAKLFTRLNIYFILKVSLENNNYGL